jgi:DNA-binding NarL/FixJ family response regulator
MRVLIVEDQAMMRDVLRRACERDFGCELAGVCATGAEALAHLAENPVEVVLLDLQLPDCDGLDLLAAIRSRQPAARILVLSSRCDPLAVHRIDRAHIGGFIDKGSQTVELLGRALAAIAAGGVYFSPAFLEERLKRRNDPASFDKVLSDREQAVLLALADCLDDRQVARKLGISAATAEKHRFNLMRKLGLKSPAEILRYARAQGFAAGHQPD